MAMERHGRAAVSRLEDAGREGAGGEQGPRDLPDCTGGASSPPHHPRQGKWSRPEAPRILPPPLQAPWGLRLRGVTPGRYAGMLPEWGTEGGPDIMQCHCVSDVVDFMPFPSCTVDNFTAEGSQPF